MRLLGAAAEKDGRDDFFSSIQTSETTSLFLMEFQSEVTLLFILTTDVYHDNASYLLILLNSWLTTAAAAAAAAAEQAHCGVGLQR